jgi:putative membrane protein
MTKLKAVFPKLIFISFIVLGIASCNSNQQSKDVTESGGQPENKMDTTNTPKGNVTDPADTLFLNKAAEINLEEIQLGKLAQQKSKKTDVKDLGKMMEEDHSKLMESLTALAAQKAVQLPTTLDNAAQADYQTLDSTSGMAFDKKYCDMMVNGHKGAIALFEKDSAETNDAAIKQWVTATIPVLRKHLEHSILCQEKYDKLK